MRPIAALLALSFAFAISACASQTVVAQKTTKPKVERVASLPVCISDAFCTIARR